MNNDTLLIQRSTMPIDRVVAGNDKISIVNPRSITYLKAFGKCEQRNNLPPGCVEIEYLESTGTQWIDTHIPLNNSLNLKVFADVNTGNITGEQAIVGNNGGAYIELYFNSNMIALYNGQATHAKITTTTSNTRWTIDAQMTPTSLSIDANGLTGSDTGSLTSSDDRSFTLLRHNGLYYFKGKTYAIKLWIENLLVADFIPIRKGTTGYMYDKVSGQLFGNDGTGDFVLGPDAVPTPDKPIDIVCNNGVLKARHQSGLPLGYTLLDYVETDGNSYIDTNLLLSNTSEFEITFQSADATLNTPIMGAISGGTSFTSTNNLCVTYTVASGLNAYSVYCNGAAGNANESWNAGDAQDKLKHTVKYNGLNIAPTLDGVDMEQLVPTTLTTNTPTVTTWLFGRNNTGSGTKTQTGVRIYDFNVVGTAHFVPCKNASNVVGMYDLVNGVFYQNAGTGNFVAGNTVSDPVEIYTDGTVETIKDSLNNTATAEMLLKVGDYQDVQSIIDGVVTRNVGVKVLDGTEEWNRDDNDIYINKTTLFGYSIPRNSVFLITHFINTYGVNGFEIGKSTFYMNNTGWNTAADFKQYLAAQYANGTPVIVAYPLASPIEEFAESQSITSKSGTNIVEVVESEIDNLDLEIRYRQK